MGVRGAFSAGHGWGEECPVAVALISTSSRDLVRGVITPRRNAPLHLGKHLHHSLTNREPAHFGYSNQELCYTRTSCILCEPHPVSLHHCFPIVPAQITQVTHRRSPVGAVPWLVQSRKVPHHLLRSVSVRANTPHSRWSYVGA